jgi:hypothetical protein
MFDSARDPAVERVGHHGERQRPSDRSEERLQELPAENQEKCGCGNEHDNERMIACPPALAVYRLCR